jgi:hypothetical protein
VAWIALALIGLLGSADQASSAEIVVVSNLRKVTVDTSATEPVIAQSVAAGGSYQKTVMLEEIIRDGQTILGNVSASAMIDSYITPTEIFARGHGTAFASGDADRLSAAGTSELILVFDLDTSTEVMFEGRISLTPRGNDALDSGGHIRLTGPNGVVHDSSLGVSAGLPDSGEINFLNDRAMMGQLTAGRYTIEAYVEGRGAGNKTRCVDYELRLSVAGNPAVPEPAVATSAVATLLTATAWIARRRARQALLLT